MKKILLILLAITICVSLCACSESITKEELIGDWSLENDSVNISILFTEENRVGYVFIALEPGSKVDTYNISYSETAGGTYEIKNDKITIDFDESTQFGLSCEVKYENGKLKIGKYSLSKE